MEAGLNKVISATIAGATAILDPALSESSIKRIVYTGTIPIAHRPDLPYKQDPTTWADGGVVTAAWAPLPP
jgi:hypothetical protein